MPNSPAPSGPHDRDAVITGIGLASCLGAGLEANWAALTDPSGFRRFPRIPILRFRDFRFESDTSFNP